ncbi:acyl carrier protein [Rugamonas apoptosis]|uniref:Acyl carrier protein n=1 Tax=Rugamonas apoptosis TaxID=2758570 RepID=A0A7W2F8X0_9BURK|nr:acyl carrier protein [Rugamonas apoptosis]MBA5687292.1 acyl carrier protein [Rugamonas apoptosis]
MPPLEQVRTILSETLGVTQLGRERDTPLLGSVPELDSMAVAGVITALEQRFDIEVLDDEINARHFATLGTLSDFVQSKLA